MKTCTQHDIPHALVIIPTLGERLDYLTQCLDSLRLAGLPTCVTIVDSSPQGLSLKSHFEDFNLVKAEPKGLSAAINLGVQTSTCSSDFITWIGDDDFYMPDGLAVLAEILLSSPNATFALGSCKYLDSAGNEILTLVPNRAHKFMTRYVTTRVAQPSTLFRRSAYFAAGGLDESLRYTMDLDLWLKFWDIGPSVFTTRVCAVYRWHSTSLSSAGERQAAREARKLRIRRFGWLRSSLSEVLSFAHSVRLRLRGSRLNSPPVRSETKI